jgi:hypothetical protein
LIVTDLLVPPESSDLSSPFRLRLPRPGNLDQKPSTANRSALSPSPSPSGTTTTPYTELELGLENSLDQLVKRLGIPPPDELDILHLAQPIGKFLEVPDSV